ncbi:uncharacterized protein JCM6883_002882 [Sporobolomyces salmoneus]|uniref:uncharacterized protein n=1 Tax=Sporobolomyces salmoneus TaxID=183962 RepID=UPI00317A7BB1
MLADLDLALKQPLQLIEKLFLEHDSTLDGFELRVQESFESLLRDARSQLPAVTALSNQSKLPRPGSLVRFRAMVQDTGYGTELYRALGAKNQLLMYGIEETEENTSTAAHEDYSKLRERQVFYIVSPPGETEWVKQKLDGLTGRELESALSNLKLSSSAASTPSTSTALPNKFPLPQEPHFGMIAKIYTDLGDKLRSTDVYEFVGILGETSLSNGFDVFEHGDDAPPPQVVPALHVLYALPAPSPLDLSSIQDLDFGSVRHELIEYIAEEALEGDLEAAEWLLLALIARIHTRHATGLALGSLSLNLAFPLQSTSSPSSSSSLAPLLSSLLPSFAPLAPTITSLNDPSTRFSPRSRDETLDSGFLQLSRGTNVLIDLINLGEGKLNDTGVRNLRSLSTTISQQKLVYEFPFSSFELETDLGFIVASEGKSIVPTDCTVFVEPKRRMTPIEKGRNSDEEELRRFRTFIQKVKYEEFSIPPEMSDVIQADFVSRRQASHSGGGTSGAMTQEDLLFRMTVSRLMALSHGKKQLDEESWMKTAELDERRKERVPSVVRERQEKEKQAEMQRRKGQA